MTQSSIALIYYPVAVMRQQLCPIVFSPNCNYIPSFCFKFVPYPHVFSRCVLADACCSRCVQAYAMLISPFYNLGHRHVRFRCVFAKFANFGMFFFIFAKRFLDF